MVRRATAGEVSRCPGITKRTALCEERPLSVNTPSPPTGTGPSGARLWESVVDDYELAEHELTLLRQAVATLDVIERLDSAIRSDSVVHETPQGLRAHPAAVEARQQRIVLARLLAALRMPAGEAGDQQATARPRRRVGVRGTYGIRGAVS